MIDMEDLCSGYRSKAVPAYKERDVAQLRENLLLWYGKERRMLPWRGDEYTIENAETGVTEKFKRERSAYGTWVSEIMLQQTRVETVIGYWHRWMTRFPNVAVLAQASPEEVNQLWSGLGYYNRAQRLLQGAQDVLAKHGGELPSSIEKLQSIPGIGPYTAGAISSIAFDKVEPLVDGNVVRVFSRLRAITSEDKSKEMENQCWSLAKQVVDPEDPGSFNQALMELGATVCKPTNPNCTACPVRDLCAARILTKVRESQVIVDCDEPAPTTAAATAANWDVELPRSVTDFPFKTAKKAPRELVLSVAVFVSTFVEKENASSDCSTGVLASSLEDGEGAHIDDAGKTAGDGASSVEKYLFVKRPVGGLLQNQWEFPNVVLYEQKNSSGAGSKKQGKGKVGEEEKTKPVDCEERDGGGEITHETVDVSASALWRQFPSFLENSLGYGWSDGTGVKQQEGQEEQEKCRAGHGLRAVLAPRRAGDGARKDGSNFDNFVEIDAEGAHSTPIAPSAASKETRIQPIVHVFSHQRHTMHITIHDVSMRQLHDSSSPSSLPSSDTKEGKWMTSEEIVEAGITSGCKKVLKAVLAARSVREKGGAKRGTTRASKTPRANKKRPGGVGAGAEVDGDTKQARISSFFEKKKTVN